MRNLFDHSATVDCGEIDDDHLAALYAYPRRLDCPWVRARMVSSVDGATAVDGRSGGLGSAADRRVFNVLRGHAEVILVGAGTVRAENYGGARSASPDKPPPPIAVVTSEAELDPASRLFTDTDVAPWC